MIKGIIAFFVVYALVYASITVFRSLTRREKLEVGKMVAYCSSVAALSLIVLTLIVLLF